MSIDDASGRAAYLAARAFVLARTPSTPILDSDTPEAIAKKLRAAMAANNTPLLDSMSPEQVVKAILAQAPLGASGNGGAPVVTPGGGTPGGGTNPGTGTPGVTGAALGLAVSRKRVIGKSGAASGSSITAVQVVRATAPVIDAVQIILHVNQMNLPGSAVKMVIAPSAKAGNNPVDANNAAVAFTPVTWGGNATLTVTSGGTASADGGVIEADYISDKITIASLARADTAGLPPLFHARAWASSYCPAVVALNGQPSANTDPDYVSGTASGDQTTATLGTTLQNATIHIPMTWVFFHGNHRVMTIASDGDSTMRGSWSDATVVDGSDSKFDGFPKQLARTLNTNGILTSLEEMCFHGEPSKNFHEIARNALNNLNGLGLTHVFLYPYSVNDGGGAAASVFQAGLTRTRAIIDLAVAKGVTPVLVRNPPGYETAVGSTNGYNAFFDEVAAAGKAVVWDMRPPMGLAASGYPAMPDSGRLHTSANATTSDSHPNNFFHATIAQAMYDDRDRLKIGNALPTGPIVLTEPTFAMSYDQAVSQLIQTEDMKFGTAAGNNITNPTQLAAKFFPLEGEFAYIDGSFEADGTTPKLLHLGGAGPTTINAEVQNYRKSFWADSGNTASPNHVFETDGLRLQATRESSANLSVYMMGQINPSGGGFWVNLVAGGRFDGNPAVYSEGGTYYWTALSDIGLQASDMQGVEIGDVVTRAGTYLCVVKDIDTTGTKVVTGATRADGVPRIMFEALTGSGGMFNYLGNFQISFTKFQFAEIATDIPANSNVTVVTFKKPLPSNVQNGSTARGAVRGLTAGYLDLQNRSGSKILSISSDRLTATFDLPLSLQTAGNGTMSGSKGDGIVFMPGVWSGQAWYRKPVGPRREGKNYWAVDIEVTFPDMPNIAMPDPGFTRTTFQAAIDAITAQEQSTGKRMARGFWPALWTYIFQGDASGIGQYKDAAWTGASGYAWVENDILEIFNRLGNGPKDITTNLHDIPYTRTVSPTDQNDGDWLTTAAVANRNTSPNTAVYRLDQTMCDGTRKRFGTIMTRDKVYHYYNGVLRSISDWPRTSKYPDQFGMNVAIGALDRGYPFQRMIPEANADIPMSWMKIHRVRMREG